MTTDKTHENCFRCNRTDMEIPLVVWSYQGQPLTVCSECMPLLIHKWGQTAARLADASAAKETPPEDA